MTECVSEALREQLGHAGSLYHRLVLVIGEDADYRTQILRDVAERTGGHYANVDMELSRCLLDHTERQRVLRLPQLLEQVAGPARGAVLLDRTHILFEPVLRQDPLRLLQRLSRNRTVAASWDGAIENGHLVHATPEHPEYRRYPVDGFLTLSAARRARACRAA